jgi:hypothetical protein
MNEIEARAFSLCLEHHALKEEAQKRRLQPKKCHPASAALSVHVNFAIHVLPDACMVAGQTLALARK